MTARLLLRASRAAAVGCLLGTAALGGCGGQRFARAPLPVADLAGHWVLDPAASDDPAAALAAALPKPKQPHESRDAEAFEPAPGSERAPRGGPRGRDGRGGRSNGGDDAAPRPERDQVAAWGRAGPAGFIRALVLPANRLDITQDAARVAISQNERRRVFEPGDEAPFSVSDRFGSRSVRAGWAGPEFAVESVDGSRLTLTERYRLLPNDRLGAEVELHARGLKTLRIKSSYRRATAGDLAAPPVEGPPDPGERR